MAEFDYSNDIAPLKGEYFSGNPPQNGMSQDEYRRMMALETAEIDRQTARSIQRRELDYKIRASELALKERQLQLQQAADAARMEREALTAIPDVTKKLTSVLEDPALDDATKTAKVAELKLQNVGLATNSKTVSNLFTAAEGTIQSRKAENDRTNALAYALTQTGQAGAVKKLFEGKQNPMAQEYIGAAEAIGAAREAESKAKGQTALQKEMMKRETAQQTAQVGMLNSYMDTLRRLAPPESKESDMTVGTLTGEKTTGPAIPAAQPFKFKQQDRIELEEMMLDLNPALENKDMSKFSDEDLYRATVRSTTSSLRKLSGFDSGFRSDKFLKTPPQ